MLIKWIKTKLKQRVRVLRALSWLNNYLYREYQEYMFRSIGKNCIIHPDCKISDPDKVIIGDNVFMQYSILHSEGGLYIGNNVGIAVGTIIWTVEHSYKDGIAIPYGPNMIVKPVRINDNVWIAAGCRIMPGVEIGEGAIISMGSVVTKDVPPCAIVVGFPARVIGYRDKKQYEELKREKKFVQRLKREKYIVPKSVLRNPNLYSIIQDYIDTGEMVIEK